MIIETSLAIGLVLFQGSPFEPKWNESKAAIESFDCESNENCHYMKKFMFRVDDAETVNQMVNGLMTYEIDLSDRWKKPEELFNTMRGDCEEFAFAKLVLLKELGFDMSKAYIHIMVDKRDRDNGHFTISYDNEYLDYIPNLEENYLNVFIVKYDTPGFYVAGRIAK